MTLDDLKAAGAAWAGKERERLEKEAAWLKKVRDGQGLGLVDQSIENEELEAFADLLDELLV